MRSIHISSEAKPFVESGGLADVCEGLPNALVSLGHETTLLLPAFSKIKKKGKWTQKRLMSFELSLSEELNEEVQVFELIHDGVTKVILIEAGSYFDTDVHPSYQENIEEKEAIGYCFFARACLEWMKRSEQSFDILHCHDWHTGLVPYFLKKGMVKGLDAKRILFTIHNLAYQGLFANELIGKLGLDQGDFHSEGYEYFGKISYLKAGIVYADCVSTVSPTYSKEIQTEAYGMGLDEVLKSKPGSIEGILNGIDNGYWDSMANVTVTHPFSVDSLEFKTENKKELQKELGLKVDGDIPMYSFIGRLVLQKGLDIIAPVLRSLLEKNVQIVFLGLGDKRFHEDLKKLSCEFPEKLAAELCFDRNLSKRIYASSDFFLMPSFFEPCGLSQMISLRFGTIPIVRRTGGLADSIIDFLDHPEEGYGIVFEAYDSATLHESCMKALMIYSQKELLKKCRIQAMTQDFSWTKVAKDYLDLYKKVLA